jgi:hypothetical protein
MKEKDKAKGTVIELQPTDKNLIKVTERYGATHKIEAVLGTEIDLDTLERGQSVVWGDGETFHFRLTQL